MKKINLLDISLFKRVLGLVTPFKKAFYIAAVLAVILAFLSPVRPYLIQLTVDEHIMSGNAKALLNMTLVLLGLLILESVLRYFFIYITNWLGQSVIRDLRKRVFDHVLNLNMKYFDRTPIGTSTTRTINDVETINQIFSEGIITILADLLTLIIIIAVMFATHWKLALISLSTLPVLFIATYIFKEKVKASFNDVRTQVAKLNAFLQEHITGMSVIQIFNAEKTELKKFEAINADHRDANIRSILYYSIFFPVVEIVLAASIGLMAWWGANEVLEGTTYHQLIISGGLKIVEKPMSFGVLIAFLLYLNMLFRPIRMLADKFNTLQMGMVAADRVFQLLDSTARIQNTGKKIAAELKGNIDFKNVWFAYEDENYVLCDVSFSIKPGETLAIVGATGAGKSSMINILNRFYEINKGTIKIDGTDVHEYEINSLRSQIGIVLQDVFLFSGSVMENITLRNEKITREQVISAAKEVGAHDFIEQLPGGYDYNVMERGHTLSVGQRQLIAFIRALVYDPKILILDEATSSVDTESEKLIQTAIEKLVKDRTSIIIAHRLSTIQHADKIIVLDKGEVKEEGTHFELLQKGSFYKKLYEMQFRNKKEEIV